MYRLLALDLDGTLVRRDGAIEPTDRAAIERLQCQGIAVAMATGRLYSGSREVAETLDLRGPQVCVDGAEIVEHPSGRELSYRAICGAAAAAVRSALGRFDFANCALAEGTVILDERGAPFERYVRGWSPHIEHTPAVLEHPAWRTERGVVAVVVIGATAEIAEAARALEVHRSAEVLRFEVPSVEGLSTLLLHATGVSKAGGLAALAEHHGCSLAQVVAVGDWLNDIPMLRAAGRSFAMGSAPPVVLEAAGEVLRAGALEGGGIAEAVARAWPQL